MKNIEIHEKHLLFMCFYEKHYRTYLKYCDIAHYLYPINQNNWAQVCSNILLV